MLGITNSIHALACIAAPVSMGAIVDIASDPAAGFRTGFLIAGAFVAAGGVIAMVLIRPEADVEMMGKSCEGRSLGGSAR